MTQILFFLTEYAEELSLFFCGSAIILLLVTLHRMKRITKLIQELAGNINDTGPVRLEMKEKNKPVLEKNSIGESETEDDMLIKRENEELLSEVLKEVFP